MKNYIIISLFLLSFSIVFSSCDSMYDVHKQYIQEEGIIYATRPFNTEVKAGNNRVIIKMLFVSGTNLRQNVIEWNEGEDSIITSTSLNSPIDSMEVELNNIEEGSYIFDVFNRDKDNNRSVKIQAIGNVYGNKYKATLLNRAVNSVSKNDTAMVIEWAQPKEGDNGVELVFNDADGNLTAYKVEADELITYIKSWEPDGDLRYTTLYLPEENAIDEFPSEQDVLIMSEN